MAFELPALRFSHDALEPHIDTATMQIHHGKHHAGYTAKLNAALENHPNLLATPIERLLSNLDAVPSEVRKAVRNNGGGYYNHCLFWDVLSPNGGGEPTGELAAAINATFGSFDSFREKFSAAAATQFGSGWAWLTVDANGGLQVEATGNQDCPLSDGRTPILTIDVWEHAYYLHYQNRRPDFIGAFYNVIDWQRVGQNFAAAKS